MSKAWLRGRTLGFVVRLGVLAHVGVAAYACRDAPLLREAPVSVLPSGNAPASEPGQAGSTEPADCQPGVPIDAGEGPCRVDFEAWTRPIGRAELVQATCTHGPFTEALPVCECRLRRARLPGDDRPWEEGTDEVVTYPGARPGSCSVYDRTPSGCLYCNSEFPGCSLDDPHSCEAVCAEMEIRYDAELHKTFSSTLRRLSCGDDYNCEFVTEIDGACYAQNPRQKGIPAFDCALSDEQLLERKNDFVEFCSERPSVHCATASDCPGGLACDERGTCVSCSKECRTPDGTCDYCAQGELCVEGSCVPDANVDCVGFPDCESGSVCVLSGMEMSTGRGNAQTRSFCRRVPDFY